MTLCMNTTDQAREEIPGLLIFKKKNIRHIKRKAGGIFDMDKELEKLKEQTVFVSKKRYKKLKSEGKLEDGKVYFVMEDRRCES